ncbi:MAG: sensor histidine kinase N-terminal domain-containing protein [Methyloprofundus sp.]|nr:sensor histidine kinase N-terminal domain-containing protein [Methyloprofundus sp.]
MTDNSLQRIIIIRLLIPVICFLLIETTVSYWVTIHYVDKTHDSALLESAQSLKQEIKIHDGKIYAELSQNALEIFTWNTADKTYFKVTSKHQGVIAGNKDLPTPKLYDADWSQPIFSNKHFNKQDIHIVSIRVKNKNLPEPVYIHVAETIKQRNAMTTDILLADLVPQLLFTLLISLYLFKGVIRGLSPLHHLTDQLAQRSPNNLSPLTESHVVTEVSALTNTINQLLARLSEASATQQRFISNAAHQLRTPLAGLKLQSEVALRAQDIDSIKPSLQQMQNSTDRLTHLITQLLTLARSSPIENNHPLEHLDLHQLVREVCINWVPVALKKNQDLSFDAPEQEIWIRGDAVLLKELLTNLIDNAIIYSPESSAIMVKLLTGEQPCLMIEDNGPGIPLAEQAHIFERFYRIQGNQGIGCGLGLAIVKEIVDLHHAHIQIKPRANQQTGVLIQINFTL